MVYSRLNPRNIIANLLLLLPGPLAACLDFQSVLASSGGHESCPIDTPWSCSSGPYDSCCYEGSNGIFLQTQFWDYDASLGPSDSWTIHGLWSDRCRGGYGQFCHPEWEIDDAKETLEGLGLYDLIEVMSTYWKSLNGNDNSLWTHEFNKHGTCMSTINPNCYIGSRSDENVGDFFKRVVSLWETLPSYEWLKEAGIEPHPEKTWSVAEFSDALMNHTNGKTVYLGCDSNNAINQIWYFFSLKGSVADGTFSNINSITRSSCTDNLRYLPKGSQDDGGDDDGGNNGAISKGYLKVYQSEFSEPTGCIISDGSWYTTGTCATFKIKETIGGVSVTSSKGPCGIVDDRLRCGSHVTASDFELNENTLYYGGSSEWSASYVPRNTQKGALRPDSNGLIKVSIALE